MSEEGSNSGGGNKGMMLIIMAMLGLIIVALVGAAVFLFLNMDNIFGGSEGAVEEPPSELFVHPDVAPPISKQMMFDLSDPIATNFGDWHFIRLENISLGINNNEPEDAIAFMRELANKERAVMDTIHRVLRRTTIEQLSAPEGEDRLREDILHALQTAFESPLIVAVYLVVYTVPLH